MLVEDDPGDQELTRRALEEGHVQCDLHIVGDGELALDYLLRRGEFEDPETSPRPDLVLLDLNLPKLDGKQVLEQMRQHPEMRRIAVVALTTSKQEADIVRTNDLGVNSYITKPVDVDEFIRTAQEITRWNQ